MSTKSKARNAPGTKLDPKLKAAINKFGSIPIGKPIKESAGREKQHRVITNEEIALRAYFIAEKRHSDGIPGDALGDWLEAKSQLLAEQ